MEVLTALDDGFLEQVCTAFDLLLHCRNAEW
ncbi:hypothetical protein BH10ACT9_BH10ACT9_43230 [soil metagenome]